MDNGMFLIVNNQVMLDNSQNVNVVVYAFYTWKWPYFTSFLSFTFVLNSENLQWFANVAI